MIHLSGQPSLASMVLTRDAVWRYTYRLPTGMEFPSGTSAWVLVTDRAGGELGVFEGEVGLTSVEWLVQPTELALIPEGANFEVFIELPDGVFKVQYGRVVRREARFPLHPTNTDRFIPQMFEDTFNRSEVGPYWVSRYGKVGMHPLSGVSASNRGMAVRNSQILWASLTLWQDAAAMWYAPVRGDDVEVKVGLATQSAWLGTGDGDCTIIICSDYLMKNWLGVRFRDSGDGNNVRVVTGKGPVSYTAQGDAVSESVPTSGAYYTIRYTTTDNTISLWDEDDEQLLLTWQDSNNLVVHGAGHRYMGAMWNGSAIHPGPCLFYWKAKDIV